jgi:hypothetical protein
MDRPADNTPATAPAQACPEAWTTLPWLRGLHVRNPHLLPFQLLGVAVGLEGGRRLLGRRSAATVYWGFSFLSFGLVRITPCAFAAMPADCQLGPG